MNRPTLLSRPAVRRLVYAAPTAAGLAPAAAVIPAGVASAASATLPANCTQADSTVTCTYGYTGAEQTFTVPVGVSSVQITAVGAPGASGSPIPYYSPGGAEGAGYPTAVPVSCATGVPVNTGTETDTAGASGLQYNATTGTYTYVWKTSKAAQGTCQVFTLGLTDGTSHTATFQYAN